MTRNDGESPVREFDRGENRWRVAWQAREGSFDIEVRPVVIPEWDESMRLARTSHDPEPFEAGDLEDSYWTTVPGMIRTVEELDSLIESGLPPDVRTQLLVDQLRADVAGPGVDGNGTRPITSEAPHSSEAAIQAHAESRQSFPTSARAVFAKRSGALPRSAAQSAPGLSSRQQSPGADLGR